MLIIGKKKSVIIILKTRALSCVHLRAQIQLFAASQLLKGAM